MSATALAHDALLPRAPGGNGAGLVLALGVHAALVLALTTAVDWRTHAPEIVAAELWASVPQTAAPRPVEAPPVPAPVPTPPAPAPAPPPPQAAPRPAEPDIATERAERRKAEAAKKKADADAEAERQRLAAEKQRADDDRKKRAQAEKEAKAEDERLARQREENLRRMMGQAGTGAPGSTGTAAQDAAPSAAYIGKVARRIREASVFPGNVPSTATVEVEVRTTPGGSILSSRVVKPSGYKDWDEAVLRAIDKAASIPPDENRRVPPVLIIAFKRGD